MEKTVALDRMMASCSRREYCRRDIFEKLKKMELPAGDAESIVETLCRERYIDELRYASAFARDKSHLQGWGPKKITVALSAKGIERDVIASALREIDGDAAAKKLKDLLEAKLRQLRAGEEPLRRMKVIRFALGRGYDYDQILKTYDNIRTT